MSKNGLIEGDQENVEPVISTVEEGGVDRVSMLVAEETEGTIGEDINWAGGQDHISPELDAWRQAVY